MLIKTSAPSRHIQIERIAEKRAWRRRHVHAGTGQDSSPVNEITAAMSKPAILAFTKPDKPRRQTRSNQALPSIPVTAHSVRLQTIHTPEDRAASTPL